MNEQVYPVYDQPPVSDNRPNTYDITGKDLIF